MMARHINEKHVEMYTLRLRFYVTCNRASVSELSTRWTVNHAHKWVFPVHTGGHIIIHDPEPCARPTRARLRSSTESTYSHHSPLVASQEIYMRSLPDVQPLFIVELTMFV